MNTEIIEYIRIFSALSFVIPLVFYLKKVNSSPIQNHVIGTLIIISGCSDLLSYLRLVSSPMLYNTYNIIQLVLITWFYYLLVYKKRSEFIVLISIGVYISILLFSFLKYGWFENYSLLWSAGSLIVTIHSIAYIFNLQTMTMDRYFDSNLLSNMIFNASMFCYFITTFIIFFLTDIIFKQHNLETIKAFWSLHNIFNILKNVGLAIGFYYTGKRKIYMTVEQLERIARKFEYEKNS
jgi:hypothetical protein